ncbi:hypothetical protein MAPG_08385 [Magnaporthiopsis poae ATCC 64411]|uniref:Uncharacterized protein n=1 Tax=Magnaporthiopsis poae (strain ATCC 64411 / 73-15) TaxID=644358 RepID=A0A0C4E782_MAGP6|nr:hypothetical protein MAPG_08385 [Magnaporthiopsis poae ATCC 64411]
MTGVNWFQVSRLKSALRPEGLPEQTLASTIAHLTPPVSTGGGAWMPLPENRFSSQPTAR